MIKGAEIKMENHKISKLSGGSLSGNLVTVARTVNINADVLQELCQIVDEQKKRIDELEGYLASMNGYLANSSSHFAKRL